MCENEKANMKKVNSDTLGSWDRAVVTSDGVWHTRGYLTNGLLWFGHKTMRGEATNEEELY